MKILIDNGHGEDTKGKSSPDGKLKEYAYTREIASRVVDMLKCKGLDAELLTPETEDVSLAERVARANEHNPSDTILVSIHVDAKGDGTKWMDATGWSSRVYLTCSENTKKLASALTEAAGKQGLKIRRQYSDKDYWTQNLYLLRKTKCPAVLTENLFQDNREDVDFLLTEEGKQKITDLHVEGICNYIGL
jgi:N-acetylmuramoyl-L-alanine amidase